LTALVGVPSPAGVRAVAVVRLLNTDGHRLQRASVVLGPSRSDALALSQRLRVGGGLLGELGRVGDGHGGRRTVAVGVGAVHRDGVIRDGGNGAGYAPTVFGFRALAVGCRADSHGFRGDRAAGVRAFPGGTHSHTTAGGYISQLGGSELG